MFQHKEAQTDVLHVMPVTATHVLKGFLVLVNEVRDEAGVIEALYGSKLPFSML